MDEQDLAALKKWVTLQDPEVVPHLNIVSREDIGGRPLLHLSTDNDIVCFKPNVSRRTGLTEDRTVPRVCMAPTVFGCISGYVRLLVDYDKRPDGFKGGWVIYGVDTPYSIRPGRAINDDVAWTREHWLVRYAANRTQYKPFQMGKCFITEIIQYSSPKGPRKQVTMYFETASEPLWLNDVTQLEPASFYEVVLENFVPHFNVSQYMSFRVTQLNPTHYLQKKGAVASLLQYQPRSVLHRWS